LRKHLEPPEHIVPAALSRRNRDVVWMNDGWVINRLGVGYLQQHPLIFFFLAGAFLATFFAVAFLATFFAGAFLTAFFATFLATVVSPLKVRCWIEP
jgi:hypothetical protein